MSRQVCKSLRWFSSSSSYLVAASGRGISSNLPVTFAIESALKERFDTCLSSCCSESIEPTRRAIESGLGKIPTTFVRRLISLLSRSRHRPAENRHPRPSLPCAANSSVPSWDRRPSLRFSLRVLRGITNNENHAAADLVNGQPKTDLHTRRDSNQRRGSQDAVNTRGCNIVFR